MRAEHYDDEALMNLIESGDDLSRDGHLTGCESCAEVATTLRQIAGALVHEDVWDQRELDESPDPRTIALLRGYADEMAREDAFAAAHLQTLLSGSRDSWMANLQSHPDYRTAGMVRALIAATDRALDTMPPDAVAMTELATAIADALAPSSYATDTVAKLRGAAWRERAYALFYVGRYAEAEAAITTAERHFAGCVVNEYELGRAEIVHALVNRGLDRYPEAVASGRKAVARLRDHGDVQRYVSAVMAQAYALMNVHDHKAALALMIEVRQNHTRAISADTEARLLANIGACHGVLGHLREAIESYRIAALLYDEVSVPTEAARMRLNLAVCLTEAGRAAEAAKEIYLVRQTFARFGMATDVAVCELALAEIALSTGNLGEVEVLCRRAIQHYERAGVPYGPSAMKALAYVTEAARQRRLTPAAMRHVEQYIRELPSKPTLLFAPLPE